VTPGEESELLWRFTTDKNEAIRTEASELLIGLSQKDPARAVNLLIGPVPELLAHTVNQVYHFANRQPKVVIESKLVSMPDENLEKEVERARAAYEAAVETVAAAKRAEMVQVQSALCDYLRIWDRYQRELTAEKKHRSAEEIASEKKALAEHVRNTLDEAGMAILRDGPCRLYVSTGTQNRRGQFWLRGKDTNRVGAPKAWLAELFNFDAGHPQLTLAEHRQELFASKENERRKSKSTKGIDF
jgi:hypothetical protein